MMVPEHGQPKAEEANEKLGKEHDYLGQLGAQL
jgi:hypothetical protein